LKPTIAPAPTESVTAMASSKSAGAVAPLESSADKALATEAPTDQNAIQHAPDSHRDHDPIELLVGRSEKLLSKGNVEAARIMLQPEANAHDARAPLAVGASYDPIMLAILQSRGVPSDAFLAPDWYKKAQQFGSRETQQRLRLLATTLAEPKTRVRAPVHVSISHAAASHVAPPRLASWPHDPDRVGDTIRKLPALSGVFY
jgi:hypothetical protein